MRKYVLDSILWKFHLFLLLIIAQLKNNIQRT